MPDESQQQETTQPQPEPTKQQEQALIPTERTTPMREMLTVLKETGDPDLFKAFAKDIIEREVAAARFGQDAQLARVFAGSGVFDGINGTTQGVSLAMTKIQLGRSWNMAPADAMEAINFINGRPSVATRYLSAKMHDAGISWDIEWDQDKDGNCTGCHLHLKRFNTATGGYDPIMGRVNGAEKQAVVSFTKKDADTAMVHEGGKQIKLSDKWNFKSWASDMYFARCVSRVRVRYAPNILSGILTREEAEDSEAASAAAVGRGAERAAIASAARTEEIGKKLQDSAEKTKPATATEQPTPAAAPSNVTQIRPDKAPWADDAKPRVKMTEMFQTMLRELGKADYSQLMEKHGLAGGLMKQDAPEAAACYREMQELLKRKEEAMAQQAAQQAAATPAQQATPPVDDDSKPLF